MYFNKFQWFNIFKLVFLLIKLRKEFETMPKAYMSGIIPKFLGVKADITPHYNNDY